MVKVVIAEDDRQVARFIARVMISMGYFPIVCSDGRRALNVLEDNPDTQLLITDVSMPEMDGRSLVMEIRGRREFRKLPIIITSGLVRVSEITDLLDIGVTCFLGKPVEVGDLKAYARSLVERGAVA
jgi:DNA-binding response OmpR family regulator